MRAAPNISNSRVKSNPVVLNSKHLIHSGVPFSLLPRRATPSRRTALSDYQIAADSDGAGGVAGETLVIVGHTKG